MSITVESTTDSAEAVVAATGDLAAKEAETKTLEVKPKEKAETAKESDLDSEESEESEAEESETSEETGEEVEDSSEKPKKKGGFKRRIEKLSSKLSAAEQEKEYWRQQALNAQSTKEAEHIEPVKAQASNRPDPNDFEEHDDYVEALTDWKLENKLSERDRKLQEDELKNSYQKQISTFQEKIQDFSKTVEDFDEAIQDVDDIPMSLVVKDIILESENGPELMYALAKNREEYERICSLNPLAAAREMGRFELKFLKQKSSEEKQQLKTTKAPKPLTPVHSGKSGKSMKSPEDMTFQEYKAWRESQP